MVLFRSIPPVTRILLISNTIIFLAINLLGNLGYGIIEIGALHPLFSLHGGALYANPRFMPHQLLSYMFLHADFSHLFFNMFSLWMFGRIIEQVFGSKRFLIFYLVCGIGAGFCQEVWQFFTSDLAPTIGASGACYGILLAFGLTYPNERIYLIIPPIPIKAKWLILGYVALELYLSFASDGNVAHFAHIGGMFFGMIWMIHWKLWPRRGYERWDSVEKKGFFAKLKDTFKGNRPRKPRMHVSGGTFYSQDNTSTTYGSPQPPQPPTRTPEQQARINAILEKVRRSGYESLTADEKRELFRSSRH